MRIRKTGQTAGFVGTVSNAKSTSTTDTYSCNYVNNLVAPTLIWTNANQNADFGSQTININATPYDRFDIEFKTIKTGDEYVYETVHKLSNKYICIYAHSGGDGSLYQRRIKFNENGTLYVDSGVIPGVAVRNDLLIPTRIIAYK